MVVTHHTRVHTTQVVPLVSTCVYNQTHEPTQDQGRRTRDADFAFSLVVWSDFDGSAIWQRQKSHVLAHFSLAPFLLPLYQQWWINSAAEFHHCDRKYFPFFDYDVAMSMPLSLSYFSARNLTRPFKLNWSDSQKSASRSLTPRSSPELWRYCLSLPLLVSPARWRVASLTAGCGRLP